MAAIKRKLSIATNRVGVVVRTCEFGIAANNTHLWRFGTGPPRVDCTASEAEAIEILKQAAIGGDPYKIAIVDRVRPRCSGLHLCRTIRSDVRLSATSLVVLMSANWNANPVDQQGLNNTVFLSKPMRRTDLIAAMARTQSPDGMLGAASTAQSR